MNGQGQSMDPWQKFRIHTFVEESEMVRLILEFLCQKYTTEPDLFML